MKMNYRLRRFGVSPTAVGQSRVVDQFKAKVALPVMNGLYNLKETVRSKLAGNKITERFMWSFFFVFQNPVVEDLICLV